MARASVACATVRAAAVIRPRGKWQSGDSLGLQAERFESEERANEGRVRLCVWRLGSSSGVSIGGRQVDDTKSHLFFV